MPNTLAAPRRTWVAMRRRTRAEHINGCQGRSLDHVKGSLTCRVHRTNLLKFHDCRTSASLCGALVKKMNPQRMMAQHCGRNIRTKGPWDRIGGSRAIWEHAQYGLLRYAGSRAIRATAQYGSLRNKGADGKERSCNTCLPPSTPSLQAAAHPAYDKNALRPMIMSTIPPAISALGPKCAPRRLPMASTMRQHKSVVTPMAAP